MLMSKGTCVLLFFIPLEFKAKAFPHEQMDNFFYLIYYSINFVDNTFRL